MRLRAKEIRKTMGTFSVHAKDAEKGRRENEINQCLGGLPTRKLLKFRAVHLFTYYAINAVYILNLFKQLTTVGMLLLA